MKGRSIPLRDAINNRLVSVKDWREKAWDIIDDGNIEILRYENYEIAITDGASGIAQIGRVVTLEHGKGVGGKILHEGVSVATELFKAKKIYLEAQEYVIGYYAKEGFKVVSEPFMEDGIPHVKMEKGIF